MTLALDRPSGLWHRPSDNLIIEEAKTVYRDLPIKPGDVLLDLGAHIGAVSRMALDRGAARVIALEPDPSSMRVLRRNLRDRRATALWAAVGARSGRARLYTHPGRPFLSTMLANERGRRIVSVPVIGLAELLKTYRPTVVKCDIEFGEYDLPQLRALPDFVRVLAMEVHIRWDLVFRHREQSPDELLAQRQQAADLIAAIEAQGFAAVRRKDKRGTGSRKATDETGLPASVKSIDAIWTR